MQDMLKNVRAQEELANVEQVTRGHGWELDTVVHGPISYSRETWFMVSWLDKMLAGGEGDLQPSESLLPTTVLPKSLSLSLVFPKLPRPPLSYRLNLLPMVLSISPSDWELLKGRIYVWVSVPYPSHFRSAYCLVGAESRSN